MRKLLLFIFLLPITASAMRTNAYFVLDGVRYCTEEFSVYEDKGNGYVATSYPTYAWVVKGDNKYEGSIIIASSITVEIYDKSLILPVTGISSSAFNSCDKLKSINIPQSVTKIDGGAFSGCDSLISIAIADENPVYDSRDNCVGVIETASNTLVSGCVNTIIPNSITSIGDYAFSGCTGLKSIDIPNSVTSIGDYAFSGCTGLKSIEIPNGITSIGKWAFTECSNATSLVIPESMTYMGEGHFSGCKNLTDIYCYAKKVPAGCDFHGSFDFSFKKNCILHVYNTLIEKYKSEWVGFKDVVAIEGTQEDTGKSEPIEDTDITKLENTLYIDKAEASVGSSVVLSVKMKNAVKVEGFSIDMYLPDSVTVAKDEDGKLVVKLSTERTTAEKTGTFTASILDDGALRVMAASTNGSEFNGNDGEVCTVQVEVAKGTAAGEYSIVLKNIVISDVDAKSYEVDHVKSTLTVNAYTIGDPNGDGIINVADYTAIAHHIMGNTPADFDEQAADVNTDGKVNVADFTGVTHLILYGQIARPKTNAPRRAADISKLDNVISIEPAYAYPGDEVELSVNMKNKVEAEGFGFDLSLPEGMSYVVDADGQPMTELSTLRTNRKNTSTFESAIMRNTGALRMFAASTNGSSFADNDGEVATITVKIDDDMKPGTYSMVLSDIAISDKDAKSHNTDMVECIITIEETTGIDAVTVKPQDGRIFNLQGQQVTDTYKGVVIRNGRKYVIR